MKHLLCRLMGHAWLWPDIVVTIQPEGLRFLPQWRECSRCGLREQDEDHKAKICIVPTFQGPVTGFRNQKLQRIGESVKRQMGWDR